MNEPKQIIIDVMDNGEVKIETKGYRGLTCKEESKFLEEALGRLTADTLKPIAYVTDNNIHVRTYKPICG